MSDVWCFVFCLLDDGFLLFLAVFYVITLSDLECDYMNARECCGRLNKWVVPQMIGLCLITMFLLLTWHWILFLIHLPLTVWQIKKWYQKPQGFIGIYDPTEIHNRSLLKGYMRESMVKLGFHIVFFFVFLYNMISSLVSPMDLSDYHDPMMFPG
ncbi:protein cornichon homolog 4-like [Tubulanus polymorphus]|uniref:protein cornichon homolog 4-like n=1 Tax=Tubulanus polymorphus TaxID=672921 RepID=UPI003DA4A9A0